MPESSRLLLEQAAQRLMKGGEGVAAGPVALPSTEEEVESFLQGHCRAMRAGPDPEFWLSGSDLLKAFRAHGQRVLLGRGDQHALPAWNGLQQMAG